MAFVCLNCIFWINLLNKKKTFFFSIMKLSFHDHGKQMLKRLFLFLNNLVGGGEKMSNEKEMSFVQQY